MPRRKLTEDVSLSHAPPDQTQRKRASRPAPVDPNAVTAEIAVPPTLPEKEPDAAQDETAEDSPKPRKRRARAKAKE